MEHQTCMDKKMDMLQNGYTPLSALIVKDIMVNLLSPSQSPGSLAFCNTRKGLRARGIAF